MNESDSSRAIEEIGSTSVVRGRLASVDEVPMTGEITRRVFSGPGVELVEICTGKLDGPVEFIGDEDEWVVVNAGRAWLDAGGTTVELGPGDWVVIARHTPHRLVDVEPGTRWLALHASGRPVEDSAWTTGPASS